TTRSPGCTGNVAGTRRAAASPSRSWSGGPASPSGTAGCGCARSRTARPGPRSRRPSGDGAGRPTPCARSRDSAGPSPGSGASSSPSSRGTPRPSGPRSGPATGRPGRRPGRSGARCAPWPGTSPSARRGLPRRPCEAAMSSPARAGPTQQRSPAPRPPKENPMTTTTAETRTLDVPGATLTYDVRGPLPTADGTPPLVLIGQPMDAVGFTTLASFFTDRTVVTYDPRGLGRSTRGDGSLVQTPEQQADDVHRLVAELGAGPVDLLGSSGGAVTALCLPAPFPDDVRTVVAHEPPALPLLPDADRAFGAWGRVQATY